MSATGRRGDWIQTRHGRQYWPLDPRPEEVAVDDIAAHLSKLCRYGGACLTFYSVAEHSVLASFLVPDELAMHALMHDAAEAYCQDVVRPVKKHLSGYSEIERLNEAAISAALGLSDLDAEQRETIKNADNAMLLAEQREIMVTPPAEWAPIAVPEEMLAEAHLFLTRRAMHTFGPPDAERLFLWRYRQLVAPYEPKPYTGGKFR